MTGANQPKGEPLIVGASVDDMNVLTAPEQLARICAALSRQRSGLLTPGDMDVLEWAADRGHEQAHAKKGRQGGGTTADVMLDRANRVGMAEHAAGKSGVQQKQADGEAADAAGVTDRAFRDWRTEVRKLAKGNPQVRKAYEAGQQGIALSPDSDFAASMRRLLWMASR